jgi:hypothetical protein
VGLMTKMHASLQELAHRNIRQCHGPAYSFFRFCRRGVKRLETSHRSERKGSDASETLGPACEMGGL